MKMRILRYSFRLLLLITFSGILIFISSFILPPPDLNIERNTIFYDEEGKVFAESKGLESRFWLPLDDIPQTIIDATILVEDQHFFKHIGFDFLRMTRAMVNNIKNMSLKEGASTLTQQYARNLFLTHEKTWKRKIKEAFYTMRIEAHYSKEEIIEGYLNTIYFGHGAYGIEAASRYFFDKHVDELSLAEITMLVGIPKGPSYYSPLVDEERAKSRQSLILTTLKNAGNITEAEFEKALNEPLIYSEKKEVITKSMSPYFQDVVLKEAADLLKVEVADVRSGGYNIYTTLNRRDQQLLTEKIAEQLKNNEEIQVGAIAMDPNSGAIKALVGGRDYEKSPFNRATMARRMPGSTFKPFLYYAALENNFTPITKLQSEKTTFTVQGTVYEPRNYNNYYADKPITLAQAIALSDNIYAVKTHLFLGMEELVKTAENFGFTNLETLPSLALGTSSVSVMEMSKAFSLLANGGKNVEGHTIKKITDVHGKVLYERKLKKEQVLNEQSAFILTDLLTGVFDSSLNGYMNVTGAPVAPLLTREYAGKSGSTDFDSWMIGYSPSLVTSVWLGYDDNRKLKSPIDFSYAKQIWAKFMEASHKDKEESFIPPSGVVKVNIDPESGLIATEHCNVSREMYFKIGTEPKRPCDLHSHPEQKVEPLVPEEKEEKRGFLKRLFDFLFSR